MSEPLQELFARLDPAGEPLPLPTTRAVRGRGRQIRSRRRLLAGTAAVGAVAVVIGLVQLGDPTGGHREPARPTVTRTSPGTMTGAPTGASPTDTGPRSADGLLRPEDLGAGEWIRGTESGDRTPVGSVTLPRCTGATAGTGVEVGGPGPRQLYRGRTAQRAEWIVDESVVRPAGGVPASATALLREAARGCARVAGGTSGGVVLAASDTLLVTGTLLPAGSIGYAQAYAIAGDAVIALETLPGGAAGSIPLPGQAQWMIDVAVTAVERATGTRPVAPAPNAAARSAASKFVVPTSVLTMPPPGRSADGGPATTETLAPAPVDWFPAAEAFGTAGLRWTAGTPDARSKAGNVRYLLHEMECGQDRISFDARSYSRRYRWAPGDGRVPWHLYVNLYLLDQDGVDDVRAAIRQGKACPAGKLADQGVSVPMPGDSYLVDHAGPTPWAARLAAGTLKGNTLVVVGVVPDPRDAKADPPVDRAWILEALGTARASAP